MSNETKTCEKWEIEYRTPEGDWGMETLSGSRSSVIQQITDRGDTALKIRPK